MMADNKQMENFLERAADSTSDQDAADQEVAEQRADEQEALAQETQEADPSGAPEPIPGSEAPASEGEPLHPGEPLPPPTAGKQVPIQALDEERHRRTEMQAKLDDKDNTIQRMNELFVDFANRQNQRPMEHMDPQAGQQPAEPGLEDDPVGHLVARISQLEGVAQGYQQQNQHQQLQQQADQAIATAATNFKRDQPEYPKAVEHLFNVEMNQHLAMGKNPAQAQQAAIDAFRYSSVEVLAGGGNPAKALFDRAVALGWQAGKEPTPNPTPRTESLEQAAAQLQRIKQGQEVNKSLSDGASGRTGGVPTSLEELAALDNDAEIMKHWDSVMGKAGVTFGGILK